MSRFLRYFVTICVLAAIAGWVLSRPERIDAAEMDGLTVTIPVESYDMRRM